MLVLYTYFQEPRAASYKKTEIVGMYFHESMCFLQIEQEQGHM